VKEKSVSLEDDSSVSEIDILPDGRVCLFGASREVLEILEAVSLGDPALTSRLDRLRAAWTDASATDTTRNSREAPRP
jgi:hypothetical protein